MNLQNIIAELNPAYTPAGVDVYVTLPCKDEDDNTVFEETTLEDPKAVYWLKNALAELLGRLPRPKEIEEAQDVIRGAALGLPRRKRKAEEPRPDVSKLSALGRVVIAVARKSTMADNNEALLGRLTTEARKLKLLVAGSNFPDTTDSLGRQLHDLIPVVAEFGVKLERDPKRPPRGWIIHRMEEAPKSVIVGEAELERLAGGGRGENVAEDVAAARGGEEEASDVLATSEGETPSSVTEKPSKTVVAKKGGGR